MSGRTIQTNLRALHLAGYSARPNEKASFGKAIGNPLSLIAADSLSLETLNRGVGSKKTISQPVNFPWKLAQNRDFHVAKSGIATLHPNLINYPRFTTR